MNRETFCFHIIQLRTHWNCNDMILLYLQKLSSNINPCKRAHESGQVYKSVTTAEYGRYLRVNLSTKMDEVQKIKVIVITVPKIEISKVIHVLSLSFIF